jgi:alpha-glucosidase
MKHRTLGAICALAILCLASLRLQALPSSPHPSATPHATDASRTPWWKNAVIYEVYPRSFQDSNGDGVGDLNGITERLGYLQSLGVNAIWLTPIYESPQVDFGYDISNYYHIDPRYGTMADFDRLVREARKHHIGVIMDLVLNHTSDKHPWFLESESSRTNPKRDWYIWRNGRKGPNGKLLPPNNWQSDFGGSAWQYDPKTRQFYYHKFYIQQPDLNWNNPQVRKAMYDVARFWIRHGVAGFRLDAITTLFEDPELRNEKPILGPDGKPQIDAFGEVELNDSLTNNLPQVHDVLRQLRQVADSYHRNILLIGETYLSSIKDLRAMYGANNDELQLPMDMQVGFIDKLDVKEFRTRINEAETKLDGDEPLFVFDNHDNVRWERYANAAGVTDPAERENIARLLATILFASRDSALMYYGDEIGMVTTPPKTRAEVRDPVGLRGWPKNKGRDGERTPMQWNSGPNAGFSSAGVKTWLPIPPSYKTVNVAVESRQPDSLLAWYQQLIALKHTNPALRDGQEIMLNLRNDNVLSWLRKTPQGQAVVVACNFTAQPQTMRFDLKPQGVAGAGLRTLMATPHDAEAQSLGAVHLGPFGVYIGQVQ